MSYLIFCHIMNGLIWLCGYQNLSTDHSCPSMWWVKITFTLNIPGCNSTHPTANKHGLILSLGKWSSNDAFTGSLLITIFVLLLHYNTTPSPSTMLCGRSTTLILCMLLLIVWGSWELRGWIISWGEDYIGHFADILEASLAIQVVWNIARLESKVFNKRACSLFPIWLFLVRSIGACYECLINQFRQVNIVTRVHFLTTVTLLDSIRESDLCPTKLESTTLQLLLCARLYLILLSHLAPHIITSRCSRLLPFTLSFYAPYIVTALFSTLWRLSIHVIGLHIV